VAKEGGRHVLYGTHCRFRSSTADGEAGSAADWLKYSMPGLEASTVVVQALQVLSGSSYTADNHCHCLSLWAGLCMNVYQGQKLRKVARHNIMVLITWCPV
jgi:hypothetical protein